MTTTIKPERTLTTAEQYERAASQLRQTAYDLAALSGIESTSYWEWDQEQSGQQPLRLPVEFSVWLLTKQAELLEARARNVRGEQS